MDYREVLMAAIPGLRRFQDGFMILNLNQEIHPLFIAPERQQEASDYASRLLKAKKRVWQDREQEPE